MHVPPDPNHPLIKAAIAELMELIRSEHPGASFEVSVGDDPTGVYITTTVDLDDTDEVLDLVVERIVDMNVEEGIPIHVVPLPTAERRQAMFEASLAQQRPWERRYSATG